MLGITGDPSLSRQFATPPLVAEGANHTQLIRNIVSLAGGSFASRVAGFATALLLARALGAEAYGWIGIGAAFSSVLALLTRAGLGPRATRMGVHDPARIPELFGALIVFRVTWALIILALVLCLVPSLAHHLGVPAELLFAYSLVTLPSAFVVQWAFLALDRMAWIAFSESLRSFLVACGAAALFIGLFEKIIWVPLIEVGASVVVVTLSTLILVRRVGPLQRTLHTPRWRDMAKEGIPITGSRFLRLVYTDGGVILVGALSSAAAAGAYLVSHRLVLALGLISMILQQAAFPTLCRLVRRGPDHALQMERFVLRMVIVLLAPAVVIAWVEANTILHALFGAGFDESAPVLQIGAATLPFLAWGSAARHLLLAMGRGAPLLITSAISAIIHIALACWLVPRFGARGAAMACLAGEIAAVLTLGIELRRVLGAFLWETRFLSLLAASAGMAGICFALPAVHAFPRVVLALAAYAFLVVLFRGVVGGDWAMLRSFTRVPSLSTEDSS